LFVPFAHCHWGIDLSTTCQERYLALYFFTVNCSVTECCSEPLAAFSVRV